jgi:hypothetical protein
MYFFKENMKNITIHSKKQGEWKEMKKLRTGISHEERILYFSSA